MKVTSLSSGSSGNCYLVQSGKISILIDSGLSASATEKYLAGMGVQIGHLSAIFLTHDHGDHLRSAGTISRKWGVPVIANQRTLQAAQPRWDKMLRLEELRAAQFGRPAVLGTSKYNLEVLPSGGVKCFEGLEVSSVPVSHDAADTVCYVFRAEGRQGMILTDLGCATEPIFEPLYNSDLIILEANHDVDLLHANRRYGPSLKARIKSDVGHLSNKQSAEILCRVLERSGTARTVWLAHLSEDNNNPRQAARVINTCLESAGIHKFPLRAALRDKPSLTWQDQEQLFQAQMLFDF